MSGFSNAVYDAVQNDGQLTVIFILTLFTFLSAFGLWTLLNRKLKEALICG